MDKNLIIFIILQLFNVILSTIKSVLTVEASAKTASLFSSISYTIGAITTKLLTEQDFFTLIIVTAISNLIGTYIGKLILEKTKKERLWNIMTTVKDDMADILENELLSNDIQFVRIAAANNRFYFNIFSSTREESKTIKDLVVKAHGKYSVVETLQGS